MCQEGGRHVFMCSNLGFTNGFKPSEKWPETQVRKQAKDLTVRMRMNIREQREQEED